MNNKVNIIRKKKVSEANQLIKKQFLIANSLLFLNLRKTCIIYDCCSLWKKNPNNNKLKGSKIYYSLMCIVLMAKKLPDWSSILQIPFNTA